MEARNAVQRIVVILVIVAGACGGAVYADHVPIYSSNFNLPIPSPDDPWSEYGKGLMEDAIIDIEYHHVIEDLDVCINLTHGALVDLQILLQSPEGTYVVLNPAGNLTFIVKDEEGVRPIGGSGEWLFDDEAEVSIEEATEPFFGLFRPVDNLSLFDKEDAYGSWCLRIYDAWQAHTGTFNRFELMITTPAPEPATATLLALAAVLLALSKPRRGH